MPSRSVPGGAGPWWGWLLVPRACASALPRLAATDGKEPTARLAGVAAVGEARDDSQSPADPARTYGAGFPQGREGTGGSRHKLERGGTNGGWPGLSGKTALLLTGPSGDLRPRKEAERTVPSPGPMLTDCGLRLRPVVLPKDAALALPWYRDPEVMWLSEGDASAQYDVDTIGRMYRYLLERGEAYIIELLCGDAWCAVGDAALCPNLIPIVIGVPEFRSKGIGSRVLRLLIARARALGWKRIGVSGVYTYNPRARRMYEGTGFRVTGVRSAEGKPDMWTLQLRLDSEARA
jgi:RimJ/RimL family protein N-acetyltransferase